jgi:hypothetical protein
MTAVIVTLTYRDATSAVKWDLGNDRRWRLSLLVEEVVLLRIERQHAPLDITASHSPCLVIAAAGAVSQPKSRRRFTLTEVRQGRCSAPLNQHCEHLGRRPSTLTFTSGS